MKNRNNKGFSLVELIVVVAIMAVLVGVLAPAYLKYVEQSREKKDLNNAEEIRHAVEVVLAEEDVFAIIGDETTLVVKDGAAMTSNLTDPGKTTFINAVKGVVGTDTIDFVSKAYSQTNNTYTITVDTTDGVKVTGAWSKNS